MNSSEIRDRLRGYKGFVGVFPCDYLPNLQPGQALIANTDPHTKPGQHWVAFYRSNTGLEYFDSFGLPPLVPFSRKYINRSAHDHFSYSTIQLQHETSETCGHHCIAFVKHRLLNQPFAYLLAHFTSRHSENDQKVYEATR
jgi:hypothetical protein